MHNSACIHVPGCAVPNACTHAAVEINVHLCHLVGNQISAMAGHAIYDERMLHGCTYVDLRVYLVASYHS